MTEERVMTMGNNAWAIVLAGGEASRLHGLTTDDSGITVPNAVAPGVVDTDISNFTKTETGREITLGSKRCRTSRG
jgi:ADP-glucose pyrophosphorylase